ncbi:hypothetical protein CMO96_01645 [Candidatus Woesebacteria bacterium]|nr:hypothetical protein [Candidatus Woesebacteria bacterium]|tara:strand:- start:76 stop:507 length:432 start_codon:yes stop_codon:yes gene_type:complete
MNVIGFNFTKMEASRSSEFKPGFTITTDIEFTDVKEHTLEVLKDNKAMVISFLYRINYMEKKKEVATIYFEGDITLSVTNDEIKEITKQWKKKKLPNTFKIPFFNLILKRCTPKALIIEEDIGLPNHLPLPKIGPAQAPEEDE